MNSYIKLGIAALLPAIISALLSLLDSKPGFGKLNAKVKQGIYGVIFGLLAIVGTEWGIPFEGATANCRDAAVITAGLFFGAPAGIIAGLIGGAERWIAVAWGVGYYTRVACTVSTMLAGVYAALLRKYMFENKKPGWFLSVAVGTVMEVIHLTMVFLTNMDSPNEAMEIIRCCAVPMILANAFSVMLSAIVLTLLSGRKDRLANKEKKARISQTIQKWLLVAIAAAFFATSYFVFKLQDQMAAVQGDNLLKLALDETEADIRVVSDEAVSEIIRNRHVGEKGFVFVIDEDYNVIYAPDNLSISSVGEDVDSSSPPDENVSFYAKLNGTDCRVCYRLYEDYCIVAILPKEEVLHTRNVAMYVNTFMEIIVFAVLFGLIYILLKNVVVDKLKRVNESLAKITDGNLNEEVNVRTNEEFASLSDDINMTVDTLKRYIDEASKRIDRELEFAKNIQRSALPSVSPVFSKRKDMDIYASMFPAKEVGGDFYDFYLTGKDKLNVLIADVSGKGIPAAMFMMRAKTELKSLTEADMELSEVFNHGNEKLCEGNEAGMFVTAWQGCIDLTTGEVKYVNAGHNPPLVRHKDGTFEFIKGRSGFVLAGMEGIKYKSEEFALAPGDILYLYTDGITEAQNTASVLYGNDRLRDTLNKSGACSMQELCECVKADIDEFVGDAVQFDDITMLALEYTGKDFIPTISFEEAKTDDIPAVTKFAERKLERFGCDSKTVMQMDVAIDEIFSNIVRYAYPEGSGPVKVEVFESDKPHAVYMRFTDHGIPYNPINAKDPDTSLSAEERDIGGLGIFMVKKTMDDVAYEYKNDTNILTVKKQIKKA